MRRVVYPVLVVVLASLVLSVVPVQAQSQLAEFRERFNGLLVQLRTIDNNCVVIFSGLLNEFDKDILHARKLITTGKGNLNRLLINTLQSASNKFDILASFAISCRFLLEGFGANFDAIFEELKPLLGVVINGTSEMTKTAIPAQGLIPCVSVPTGADRTVMPAGTSTTIDPRKACRIVQLAIDAFTRVIFMLSALSLTSILADGAAITSDDVLSQLEAIIDAGRCVRDDQEIVTVQPMLTETGPICFEQLREFKVLLGKAHQQIRLAIQTGLREFVRNKKWVLKAIREIKELLRASNFGGRAASEILSAGENVTRVYTLNGHLISIQTASSLNTEILSNGVYLLIREAKDIYGQNHRRISKLVVAR
jgi:hypothetical protein